MENSQSSDEDDPFFDAPDDLPFFDCFESFDSTPYSSLSLSSRADHTYSLNPPESSSSGGLRRRRSFSHRHGRHGSGDAFEDSRMRKLEDEERESKKPKDEERESRELGEGRLVESVSEEKGENSTVTIEEKEQNGEVTSANDDERQFNCLIFIAELIFKAIGFQFNLFISFFTLPMKGIYYSVMFVMNPFQSLSLGRDYVIRKLMGLWKFVCPSLSDWLNEHKSFLNVVFRCGWGLFWSVYVCIVLVILLISAFMISGVMMRYVVEEPFQLKQALNFDYTKDSPVVFVPITSCSSTPCLDCVEDNEFGDVRGVTVIPPNHKLQATVTLVLPESDYNRNLGIFQVRVEFLSANGKPLASLSHPCMLKFKSDPIRLLLTLFKVIPLVTGYISESQTLNLKFKGFTERDVHTACLKVAIEQRAEFRPAGGIPEVYDAFLLLESQLPFLKRIIWCWKKTIFVWLSMMLFMMQLLFVLVCCRPIILPRARSQRGTSRTISAETGQPVQRHEVGCRVRVLMSHLYSPWPTLLSSLPPRHQAEV